MNSTGNARRLRRDQTKEETQLWQALRAGRFAGFKFRRQHPIAQYALDFYCPLARLSLELDGFQHGVPRQIASDLRREEFLLSQHIEELRFWNHQWPVFKVHEEGWRRGVHPTIRAIMPRN
jgi:very-short-patch-repair endonuclease